MANKNKVTQELLARYQSNECTPEERVAVESWLQDLSFSDQSLPDKKEGEIIWKAVAKKTIRPSKPIITFRKHAWISAAACFLAVLSVGLWLNKHQSASEIAVRIAGSTLHVVGGLEIKPLRNEDVFYTAGEEHFNGEIKFCKMFLVKNLQGQAQKIKLKTDCEEGIFPTNFVFQPGKSYIVVVDNEYNSPDAQQLYVAPVDGLRRLPKGVELRVRQGMEQLTI